MTILPATCFWTAALISAVVQQSGTLHRPLRSKYLASSWTRQHLHIAIVLMSMASYVDRQGDGCCIAEPIHPRSILSVRIFSIFIFGRQH